MQWKYNGKTGTGTLTRRQHFVVIFRRHLFDPRGSFHGTLKYHKIGLKLGYYIRTAHHHHHHHHHHHLHHHHHHHHHLWITVVNMIDDCEMLILRLCFSVLSEIASSRVCRFCFWFVSTNRRPCFWFVPEESISDLSNMIFYQIL